MTNIPLPSVPVADAVPKENDENEEEEAIVVEPMRELNVEEVDEEVVAEAPSHPPIAAFVELSAHVAAAQAAVEEAEVAIHENSGRSGSRKRKPAQHKMDF